MKLFSKSQEQILPLTLEEAWEFFSSPDNLQRITPPAMRLIPSSTDHGEKMYAGQLITYRIKPLLGIPVNWCTEITHVQYQSYFVDEQRFGPYAFWHHRHFFERHEKGTLMKDIVYYALPMGFIGALMEPLLVKPKLDEIFSHRHKALISLFGEVK
jgi:ligand-binding SRPBCC domain-containing protein